MIFFDTETCGLHGVPIIIQYAENDGPVEIYNFWRNPIKDSLMLIEWLCLKEICAFNLVFDWFHICKIYNLLRIYKDHDEYPENIINELALLEATARDGLCLKPKNALDLMLHARKGPYQATMDRKDIRIKRVPTAIAYELAAELERRVPLKDIYFGRRVDKTVKKWQVEEVDDEPDFKNIVLRFAPTSALKALAIDALNLAEDDVLKYADIEIDRSLWPNEVGYAPFATALGTSRDWKHTWPEVIHYHIEHWEFNTLAREYAVKDVIYLQRLYDYFGHPACGDDDSILACTIAAIRWKGYQIALPKIKALRNKALEQAQKAPQAPNYVKRYIEQDLSEIERIAFNDTKKITLEEVAKWEDHPAAIKARAVLDARMAQKEIELYDKLIQAGRFHASFKIIGALSGRMSGADQLNPQAIKNTKEVRACFPLAPEGLILCGGDFESFEVCIGVAYYNDPDLYAELSKEEPCLDCKGAGCRECKGTGKSKKKIHALFGEELYPEETYESILASKGTENDMYKKAKSALFAMGMYGGTGHTIKERLGIDEHIGDQAKEKWARRFPGIGKRQREIHNQFCSMRQPGGIGTLVEWHRPSDYVESMLGFRRYFTLENSICKALFDLGQQPPKHWLQYKFKVMRRDRDQTASGAARSACFAAAFAIQGANLRAANNHVIQSTGAEITKHVQRKIADLQPIGIHPWVVMPMNIHDEIMVPVIPEKVAELKETVILAVNEYKPTVPLISIDWREHLETWADKS